MKRKQLVKILHTKVWQNIILLPIALVQSSKAQSLKYLKKTTFLCVFYEYFFCKELLFIQVYLFILPNLRFNDKLSNCKNQIVNCQFFTTTIHIIIIEI
jgi:hypothetical protein